MQNTQEMRFDGKVAVITGAGTGLGREYALFLASRGAKVVVNDLGTSLRGTGMKHLNPKSQDVVDEILKNGGQAVSDTNDVNDGDKIIKTAIDNFGKVDILINNAGILRDISFQKMNDSDWDKIIKVHLRGTFKTTRAAWNIMREQGYGRIINTSSGTGLYGNFGQANYSSAKLGIHGLTLTLAKEGERRNIKVNTIAPVAHSRMTETILPKEALDMLKPEYVVPLVAFLVHESCDQTGNVFEVGAGFIAKLRWQRAEGSYFNLPFTPEEVRERIGQITDFTRNNDYPLELNDTFTKFSDNQQRIKDGLPTPGFQSKLQQKDQQKQVTEKFPLSGLKSEGIFQLMRIFLERGEGKEAVQQVQGVYNFGITLTKGGKIEKSWIIDLKNEQGSVKEGELPNADATFVMSDDDFEQVCLGNLNPQNAFIQGKMKIKGNMRLATKFTPELFPPPTPENVAKYLGTGGKQAQSEKIESSGLKSEQIFEIMRVYLERGEGQETVNKLKAIYNFAITEKKGGPVAKSWIIDLKNGKGQILVGSDPKADASFTMTDEDFFQVCNGSLNPQNAFIQGKMKIKGNMRAATAFTPELFPAPTPENIAKYSKSKL